MEEFKDAKILITIDGANIYNGDPVFVDVQVDKLIIETKIGKTKIQTLHLEIERDVYVEKLEEEEEKPPD